MKSSYPDHYHWKLFYCEEYQSLTNQHTYKVITRAHYIMDIFPYVKMIPTICVQTLKYDEYGNAIRVKSWIVALGNHEDSIWSKSDRYTLVIGKANHRLLSSYAVKIGQRQKQGDCNNAFLHLFIPEDEIIICSPPLGCPLSGPDGIWLL